MFDPLLVSQEANILYLTIFLTLLGGAFFLPFPEDLVLISAGILVQSEMVDLGIVFIIAYCTIILGDIILYGTGYFFGMNLFVKRWFRNRVHPSKIKKVRKKLDENFIVAIVLARHLFYLRSITFLTCGAVRMSFVRYIIADMLAAFLSCSIMIGIGYIAGENYTAIKENIDSLQLGVLAALLIGGLVWWRKRKSANAANELSAKQKEEAANEL